MIIPGRFRPLIEVACQTLPFDADNVVAVKITDGEIEVTELAPGYEESYLVHIVRPSEEWWEEDE